MQQHCYVKILCQKINIKYVDDIDTICKQIAEFVRAITNQFSSNSTFWQIRG